MIGANEETQWGHSGGEPAGLSRGPRKTRGHRGSHGSRNTLSVSWQSDANASWVHSLLKALVNYVWNPPHPRLNSTWPSAFWAASQVLSLAWSSVLSSPLFFFLTLLWQYIESYRGWTWDYSLEGLLPSVRLYLAADPLMPFFLRISMRFILWDVDLSASLQGWLL